MTNIGAASLSVSSLLLAALTAVKTLRDLPGQNMALLHLFSIANDYTTRVHVWSRPSSKQPSKMLQNLHTYSSTCGSTHGNTSKNALWMWRLESRTNTFTETYWKVYRQLKVKDLRFSKIFSLAYEIYSYVVVGPLWNLVCLYKKCM